jgi:predicted ATPase/class 3 adenylate cyclase
MMGLLAVVPPDLASYAVSVETLTFLFTDIEGSTALLQRVGEDVYAQVLADHHGLIRSGLAAHGGEEVDTQGDGFFAVFSSPKACVAAVAEMQQAVAAHAWPAGEHVRVRMGVHTGEASKAATGLVGLDVHRAARVAAVAHGGQVLLSESAAVLARDWLPPGTALRDLGVHRLKDLGRPEQIFQLCVAGLQGEFPPLRSLGNPALANNLPAQLAKFIGRQRELSQVRALVGSSRLVTLTGAGGSGKTRLSLQVAADLLDGSGDGVWLAELAAVSDEEAVVPAICGALGMAGRGQPNLETLVDALAPQDVLIVLDNCEHLIGPCAKTAEAVLRRCPRVHLLVTSREPLGIGGETVYRVPPLSLPAAGDGDVTVAEPSDAVTLFAERAREQGASLVVDEETGPLVASICRRLDGMPLAIELAAARLRSMSLAVLRDRLDQRFRLLTGGSRTALPRQQTLRATVEWSHSLLAAPEQVLLRRLSVFAESFDLDAAEAVCGFGDIETFDVAGLLGSLVDKSLVVAEPAGAALRYRLLETIRQFAAERLADAGDGEADVGAAHSGHFLALAEEAAPHLTGRDQGLWFARLDADHANLRRAADHAARDPDGTGQVLRFGVALRHYWTARSLQSEAAGLLLPVLERPEARAHPELFAAALVTATLCARDAGLPAVRQLGERAVEAARGLADDRLLIEALSALCAYYYFAGQPGRGFPLGREAVERARQLGDDFLLGFSLLLWLLTSQHMDPARVRQLFAEAIAAAERSGDQQRNYRLHNNAAVGALRAGDTAAARAHLDQAAQAMAAIGQENSPQVPTNRGWVLRQENDTQGARPMFEAALRISRRNADRSGLAYASLGLACLAADCGDWQRAAVLHGAAQAFIDQVAEPWQEPEARYRRDSLDKIRTSFGEEQFGRAYGQGTTLSLDQALGLALGTARPA